jgi:hypothetical protein
VYVKFEEGVQATIYSRLFDMLHTTLLKKGTLLEKGPKGFSPLVMAVLLQQVCCHPELVPEDVRDRLVLPYKLRNTMDDPTKNLDDVVMARKSVDKKRDDFDPRSPKIVAPRSPKIVALLALIRKMPPNEKVCSPT